MTREGTDSYSEDSKDFLQIQQLVRIGPENLFFVCRGNQMIHGDTAYKHAGAAHGKVRGENKALSTLLGNAPGQHAVTEQTGTCQVQIIIFTDIHPAQMPQKAVLFTGVSHDDFYILMGLSLIHI